MAGLLSRRDDFACQKPFKSLLCRSKRHTERFVIALSEDGFGKRIPLGKNKCPVGVIGGVLLPLFGRCLGSTGFLVNFLLHFEFSMCSRSINWLQNGRRIGNILLVGLESSASYLRKNDGTLTRRCRLPERTDQLRRRAYRQVF